MAPQVSGTSPEKPVRIDLTGWAQWPLDALGQLAQSTATFLVAAVLLDAPSRCIGFGVLGPLPIDPAKVGTLFEAESGRVQVDPAVLALLRGA